MKERNRRIIELYKQGVTLETIADEVNLTRERVRQIAMEAGLPGRNNLEASERIRNEIEDVARRAYEENETFTSIGESYGVSHTQIRYLLRNAGLYKKGNRKRGSRTVNHNLFDKWTDEAYYVAGWIAGDGCVSNDLISICQKYKQPLENLAEILALNSDKKPNILYYERQQSYDESKVAEQYFLNFTSKKMIKALNKEGITERKSLTIEVSDRLANSPVFWRAIIEADGSIGTNNQGNSFVSLSTGSLDFANQYQNWLSSIGIDKTYLQHLTNDWGTGIQVVLYRKDDVRLLLETLYSDAQPEYRYERKYKNAMEVLEGT